MPTSNFALNALPDPAIESRDHVLAELNFKLVSLPDPAADNKSNNVVWDEVIQRLLALPDPAIESDDSVVVVRPDCELLARKISYDPTTVREFLPDGSSVYEALESYNTISGVIAELEEMVMLSDPFPSLLGQSRYEKVLAGLEEIGDSCRHTAEMLSISASGPVYSEALKGAYSDLADRVDQALQPGAPEEDFEE